MYWHGDPERLPAPWAHRCGDPGHPWFQTTQGRCPGAYIYRRAGRSTDLCIIQKLDNLLYLEYKLQQKERCE